MRQSGDTMGEDNLFLVNAVKKYACLYNFNIPEYMKKDDTDAAWNEVANCMRQTVQECKEKWRNLRYSFLRSLKPHPDGTAKKKYYLHKEMEFLLPYMKTRNEGIVSHQFDEDSDDEINTDINNGEEAIVTEELTNHLDYCTLEFAEPLPKRRKTNYRSTRDHGNTECPRKMFLLSLLPEINSLTEVQMKAFRRNIFKMIDKVSQNDESIKLESQEIGRSNRENTKKLENSTEEIQFITSIKTEPL